MSNPREIAAVLAATDAVREALRRCDGPGWELRHGRAIALCGNPDEADDTRGPWLPVDPTTIVMEAARLAGSLHHGDPPAIRQYGGDWVAETHWTLRTGSTPRLAALALLAAIVEGRV